jgi:hypothetical protein
LFVVDLDVSFPSPLPSIFFSFFRRRFLSRLPADTQVTQLHVLRALLHKTKKETTQQPPCSTFRASQASCGPA